MFPRCSSALLEEEGITMGLRLADGTQGAKAYGVEKRTGFSSS